MFRNRQDCSRTIRFAIAGALATALAAGCAGSGQFAKAGAHADQPAGKATRKADRTVADAEAAVLRNPRDAAARAALGSAYLEAGRFASAAATFQDAIALGDGSGSTALRLALAQIGSGRAREAAVILDMHRETIPAGDLGLALALAGETARGVDILTDALRGGENTPKLRQNLAYAFALDGRWAEARAMVAMDLPADMVDARLGSWALAGRPEDYNRRVAGLLGAPVRTDEGQPVELALGGARGSEGAPVEVAAVVPPAPAAGELPAVDVAANDPSREFVIAEEAPAAAPVPAASTNFSQAFVEAPRPPAAPAVKPIAMAHAGPRSATKADRAKPVVAATKPVRSGGHGVQLGSFSSSENAQRATTLLRARHPELKDFNLTVTPAVVNGKKFWRVSAAGFSQASALGTCSRVKTRGGVCIAYSVAKPLPGVAPRRAGAPALARR